MAETTPHRMKVIQSLSRLVWCVCGGDVVGFVLGEKVIQYLFVSCGWVGVCV